MSESPAIDDRVRRGQQLLAHAWMVRTFIKHCEEVEDFPELMGVARSIFDLCRALEDKVDSPEEYLRILRKKLSRFRSAVADFARDAPLASTHMNFQQAVVSIEAVYEQLACLAAPGTVASPSITPVAPPPGTPAHDSASDPTA